MYINEILVAGNVGHSAQDKTTAEGKRLVKFSLAHSGRDNTTTWFNVTVFGGERSGYLADDAAKVQKGDRVLVKGRLEQRSYMGRDQTPKTSLEITATHVGILQRRERVATAPASDYVPTHGDHLDGVPNDDIPF